MTAALSADEMVEWKRFLLGLCARLALAYDQRPFLREATTRFERPDSFELSNEVLFLEEALSALETRVDGLKALVVGQGTRLHPFLPHGEREIVSLLEQVGTCLHSSQKLTRKILEARPPLSTKGSE